MTQRSPDGEHIDSPAEGQFDIYIVSVNGGHGAWRTLVIQVTARQGFSIQCFGLASGKISTIANLEKTEGPGLAVSPDARWIWSA